MGMVKLSVHDSSVLSRLAQYRQLPKGDQQRMLEKIKCPKAHQVGQILMGEEIGETSEEVRETARVFREWAEANRREMTVRARR